MLKRAYSLIEVKSFDEERRELAGMATTPAVDRVGDIVEPMGATFAPDLPLLMHHDPRLVVGRARLGQPTARGIPFTATLPKNLEPGALRDRVDEAWSLVKHRLVTGVSIAFKPIGGEVERIEGGLRFKKYEILELSLVPIPANGQATIQTVKALDLAGPVAAAPASVPSAGRGMFFDSKRFAQQLQARIEKEPPQSKDDAYMLGLLTLAMHLGTNAKSAHEGLAARLASLEAAVAAMGERLTQLESQGPPAVAIDIAREQNGLMSRITVTPTAANSPDVSPEVIAALVHSNSRGQ